MRLSSLIGHAHELLTEILRRPAIPADGVISRFYRERRYLGGRDRGYITETVYNALRDVLRNRALFLPEMRNASLESEAALLLAASLLEHDSSIELSEVASGVGLAQGQLRGIREVLGEANAQIETLPEPMRTAVRH